MPVATVAGLRKMVGTGSAPEVELQRAIHVAATLLDRELGAAIVPVLVREQVELEVAAEVYNRGVRLGPAQLAETAGSRPARDPLDRVRPILARYLVPF